MNNTQMQKLVINNNSYIDLENSLLINEKIKKTESLQHRELKTIAYLIKNPGRFISIEELTERILGPEQKNETMFVRNIIMRIRKKLCNLELNHFLEVDFESSGYMWNTLLVEQTIKFLQQESFLFHIKRGICSPDISKEFLELFRNTGKAYERYNEKEDITNELSDAFVTVLGIAEMLDIDLENQLLKKLERL